MMSPIEKKPLPNPIDVKIVPPSMDYIYLEHAEKFPFRPKAEGHDPVNQWWLADCAFLVYCHPNFARLTMIVAGMPEYRFFDGSVSETFVAANKETVIVSFRGTEVRSMNAFFDLVADFNFRPVEEEAGGMVHRGFKEGLDDVWHGTGGLKAYLEDLLEEEPKRKIWFTGHSLGGALATLAAARFPRAQGLYTFGAPKVGDEAFVQAVRPPAVRIVNNKDPIPLLPPNVTIKNWSPGRFRHTGELAHIDKSGRLSQDPKDIQELSDSFSQSLQEFGGLAGKTDKAVTSLAKRVFTGEGREKKLSLADMNPLKLKGIISDYLPGDMTDHAPVYYAVHSWNILAEKNSTPG